MAGQYPAINRPPDYFGPTDGLNFLINFFLEPAAAATYRADPSLLSNKRDLFTYGTYSARSQWQHAIKTAHPDFDSNTDPVAAEARTRLLYSQDGEGKPCFVCGRACSKAGGIAHPDYPQVEHIFPSAFSFFLFGLSAPHGIGGGHMHTSVLTWFQQQSPGVQSAVHQMLRRMSFYSQFNFAWADRACNGSKDALVLINYINVNSGCVTSPPENCDIRRHEVMNINNTAFTAYIAKLARLSGEAKRTNISHFILGDGAAAMILGMLATSDYQTNWSKYFHFNVNFAALTATLALRQPVSPRLTNYFNSLASPLQGGRMPFESPTMVAPMTTYTDPTKMIGSVGRVVHPPSYYIQLAQSMGPAPSSSLSLTDQTLDLISVHLLFKYWEIRGYNVFKPADVNPALFPELIDNIEDSQEIMSAIHSKITPYPEDNAGGNKKHILKGKKTRKRKINKKRTHIRKRKTHKKPL
jgi:hypothetical protein